MNLVFVTIMTVVMSTAAVAQSFIESNAERYFESIKTNPQKLMTFLQAMPKGGDLHNHESGATYAENMIHYAYNDHLCIDHHTYVVFRDPDCSPQSLLNNAIQEAGFYDRMIDAWSMRHFQNTNESGHDHFFSTFGKFSLIANNHRGEIVAEIAQRAGLENESYIELMVTADNNESGQLGKLVGWDPNFANMREKLLAANFDKIVTHISTSLDQDEATMRSVLACATHHPKMGCKVKVRYLYQVLREQTPEMVFAQLLAGFEAANKDRRVVGLNMVQPEDGTISMRDYKLQMQMVRYLHHVYPTVHISLHAGELSCALVPAEGLTFHIHDAVAVAGANRIGHGVDIAQEDQAEQLLKEMAEQHVLVEINLSSNASILNIQGKNHPLPLYMRYEVPVTLSTDDEGVSRSNLTTEYEHAVSAFQFNYLTLKKFVRNSLTYSFLPGKMLWKNDSYRQLTFECGNDMLGSDTPSPLCKAFLDANEKAKLQWDLEKRFAMFESKF